MAANTFDVLRDVVEGAKCKPGWSFNLVDEDGALRLVIRIDCEDNYDPDQPFAVRHFHPVPTTTYNEKSWHRWVFEQCMRTMTHEIGEALRFGPNEERPFEPCHGPGEDPYTVHEYRDPIDALITQNGSLRSKDEI